VSALYYLNKQLQWPAQVTGKWLLRIAALLWALDTRWGWVLCSPPTQPEGRRKAELPARAKPSPLSPALSTSAVVET